MKRLLWLGLLFSLPAWSGGEKVAFPHQGVELAGRMYAPEGKGPFPAIVLLHGCNGMWGRDGEPNATYEAWAKHFQERGYVALLLDSFGPRGQQEICTQGARLIHPRRDRAGDAHAARRWLAARSEVLAERVYLLGWSNGGATVLYAVGGSDPDSRKADGSFRAAVALYPGCRDLVSPPYETRVPLLIQAGGADDWTPARYCEALAAEAKGRGAKVHIDVYEGAHHAFDAVQGQVRFRPDVRNPSSPSGWGAHIGPNPAAREKAKARVLEFLETHR